MRLDFPLTVIGCWFGNLDFIDFFELLLWYLVFYLVSLEPMFSLFDYNWGLLDFCSFGLKGFSFYPLLLNL